MPHDGPGEHYHDVGERVGADDDRVVWTTVGLDIGSTTSQAVFSRITLAREDAYYVVIDRSILHQSAVVLTPYATPVLIDQTRLAGFLDDAFAAANLTRTEIDTGAVIMTGLALSTENARAIADVVADDSGAFVAVSAGDVLEARLAANGAGLPELSAAHAGVILHVDIGGGTTKLSTWEQGALRRVAAIDVGARLVRFDEQGRVTRVEPAVTRLAKRLNFALTVGATPSENTLKELGAVLAAEILRHGGLLSDSRPDPWLLRTAPLYASCERPNIRAVVFSGGVSEYIYEREPRAFGDLGGLLGRAVRTAMSGCEAQVIESECGIRATVLGASQHSVQLSGNTIYVSDPAILPLRNLPVVLPALSLAGDDLDARLIEAALTQALAGSMGAEKRAFAVALRWEGSPTFKRLNTVAEAIVTAVRPHLSVGAPCVAIVDGDVAGLLGSLLERLYGGRRAVVCLDGVHIHEFDHIDIGEFGPRSRALPVVVKSLLFAQALGFTHVHH